MFREAPYELTGKSDPEFKTLYILKGCSYFVFLFYLFAIQVIKSLKNEIFRKLFSFWYSCIALSPIPNYIKYTKEIDFTLQVKCISRYARLVWSLTSHCIEFLTDSIFTLLAN